MFIRYFVDLPMSFGEAERALLDTPEGWVPGLLREAEHRGQHLLADIGFQVDTRRFAKEVSVELGTPNRIHGVTTLPISWRATRMERLFPHLDADIEVAALGASRTQLAMSARYRPPMGALGRVLDKALLHRVAEATVKDFLDRVGEGLTIREGGAS
jgi:hypothetical protein